MITSHNISENNQSHEKHSDWFKNEYNGNPGRYGKFKLFKHKHFERNNNFLYSLDIRPIQSVNVDSNEVREHPTKVLNAHNSYGTLGPRMNNYPLLPTHHPMSQNVPHPGRMQFVYPYHSAPRHLMG